jgi:hypothetical protein
MQTLVTRNDTETSGASFTFRAVDEDRISTDDIRFSCGNVPQQFMRRMPARLRKESDAQRQSFRRIVLHDSSP